MTFTSMQGLLRQQILDIDLTLRRFRNITPVTQDDFLLRTAHLTAEEQRLLGYLVFISKIRKETAERRAAERAAFEAGQAQVAAPQTTVSPSSKTAQPRPESPSSISERTSPPPGHPKAIQPPVSSLKPPLAQMSGIPKIVSDPMPSKPEVLQISLPNGKEDQPYRARIEEIMDPKIRDDDGSGLIIDETGHLSGLPLKKGLMTLTILGLKNARPVTVHARLLIIPDPMKAWLKVIPSDPSAPFAKPDEDFATRQGEAFLLGASLRGRSHAIKGDFRDDDFALHVDPSGWHILVACDGAGSAPLSREGSRLAAKTATEALPSLIAEHLEPRIDQISAQYLANMSTHGPAIRSQILYPVLAGAAMRAATAIGALAQAEDRPVSDFYTTLLLAISRKVGDMWFTASFGIGDGGIVLLDLSRGEARLLSKPDSGEYAGQTRFLTRAEFADAERTIERIFIDMRPDFTALAVMTDGITDPLFPTDEVLADLDAWARFWNEDLGAKVALEPGNPNLRAQMLDWIGFFSAGNHDDRTLLLMLAGQS